MLRMIAAEQPGPARADWRPPVECPEDSAREDNRPGKPEIIVRREIEAGAGREASQPAAIAEPFEIIGLGIERTRQTLQLAVDGKLRLEDQVEACRIDELRRTSRAST